MLEYVGAFLQLYREEAGTSNAPCTGSRRVGIDYVRNRIVANKLMKGFIGTANIDTNSRLCMASSVAGHIRVFGEDVVPGVYDDIEQTDLAVLVG